MIGVLALVSLVLPMVTRPPGTNAAATAATPTAREGAATTLK